MLPETSMSAWIPALHAGMTQSRRAVLEVTEVARPLFSKEHMKCTKVLIKKVSETFVSFAPFVVRVFLKICCDEH
jgi:hypothetical protein